MTTDKPKIRSSSLPMFMSCSNAVLNPHYLPSVETENETATLGHLIHEACQLLVETGELRLGALKDRLPEKDFDRAAALTNNFLTVWNQASKFMKNPVTEQAFEVELSHCILTGHIDCYHLDPARAFVLDYKTGRQHEDHYHQMAGYAYGVWDKAGRPAVFSIYVTVVYLEDNTVKPYEFTPDILRSWEKEVAAQVIQQRYTVGRKCAFCTLQDSCPAYKVYATNAITTLGQLHENDYTTLPSWGTLSPEERGQIVDQMYVIDKALDRVRLSLRNHLKTKGPVDIGDGKEYTMVEQEEKQIDVPKALNLLKTRIGEAAIARLSRLPLDSVLTAFAAKAAKGRKTVARRELLEELDAHGALVRSTSTKMWRRPKGEQTLEVSK